MPSRFPLSHPPAASARPLRSLPALLAAVCLLTAACYGQTPPDPNTIVNDASYNELHALSHGSTFRYRDHKIDNGVSTVKEVVETNEGDVSRLLMKNGKPLSADANQAELARLNALRDDPSKQAAVHQKSQENNQRDSEMVRVLPHAFLYTYLGAVQAPNGPAYRLAFKPNPNFQPPDRQAEVFHGMSGELWVDTRQQRMVRFQAHLIQDVDFGWGIFGKLFKGGTIWVQQEDVGGGHWELTHMRLHLSGKILVFKSLTIHTIEDQTDFHPVPDDGYKAAIALLEQMPLPDSSGK